MSKPVKAIGKAVGSVFKGIGKAVSGIVKGIGKVVGAVIDFVVSPFMGILGIPSGPNDSAEEERQTGVLIQSAGSNVKVPVVYGYRKIAGTVVFAETGATKNKYLWVAYTFAEGQATGIRRLFIDDYELEGIADNLNTGYPIKVNTGKYKDRVLLQAWGGRPYHGSEYFDAGSASLCVEAPSWKSTHSYNGLVTIFARYEWKEQQTQEDADNNPFGGSIPKLQIELLGKTVASLVTTASESYDYYDWNSGYTERYSTNPAEILLDYLRNPDYGKGVANSEIDWASFRTAAAKYNQTVDYGGGIEGPYLTTNYVLDTNQTIFNNVKMMLANMRGYLPYQDGKYKLVVEDAGNADDVTSPTATIQRNFTKDNIVGNIVYTGIEKSSKYNGVVVKYVDPGDKWSVQEAVFPTSEATRQAYIAEDGGRVNKYEVTMGGITNFAMALYMARTIFFKSRFQDTCSFTATSEAFDLEPGDNIYINGNILQFGDENSAYEPWPWRIVSKQLNDDYTFDLGCVRNPDFIYPFVQAGPRDEVLPPYIPKGAEIEYPGPGREYDVGLRPPTRIRQNVNYTQDPSGVITGTPIGFPTVNDPTGANGGGVGAPDSPTNTDPVNDDPPQAPTIPPLDDYITIDRAQYELDGNAVYATLTFSQPGHPFYAGLDLYYKRNISTETVWTYVDVTEIPGEGNQIQVRIGPLLKGKTYNVKTKVRYSNGEKSTFISSSYLNNVGSTLEDNPSDFATNTGEGWTLPTDEGSVIRRDTLVSKIVGAPILSGGNPVDPRRMNWTFTQDIDRRGYNGNVIGINIYYKPTTATYWNKSTYNFPSNYTPGFATTFELPFELGQAGSADDYDFVVRFVYKDNTESERQYRVMNVQVETNNFGQYDFDPFYGTIAKSSGDEDVSAYSLITVDNAPPGAVLDPRDFQISFQTQYSLASNRRENIVFVLNEVDDDDKVWQGVRMYYRPVVAGENPDYEVVNFLPITRDAAGLLTFTHPIIFDKHYEYVLVPIVYYNSAKTQTNQAWYGSGAIHDRLVNGLTPNFFELLNFKLIDTDVALNNIKTTFAQTDPTVQVQKWSLIQTSTTNVGSNYIYYQLQFYHQHITGYEDLTIYRRNRNTNFNYTNYYGVGRWEEITVTDTNTDPNGVVTVNLRAPIDYTEYTSTGTATQNALYDNAGAEPLSRNQSYDEFFLVVNYSSSSSSKGLFLNGIKPVRYNTEIDGLAGYGPPAEIEVSKFNTYPSGNERNLTDARAPVANSAIWIKEAYGTGNYSPPSVTPTIV